MQRKLSPTSGCGISIYLRGTRYAKVICAADRVGAFRRFHTGPYNRGIVFRIAPDGTFTTLHAFGGTDGAYPLGSLKFDSAGNLYGSTPDGSASDNGVVFKLAPDGRETVLHSFVGDGSDGVYPNGGLVVNDTGSKIYGATFGGGGSNSLGTVFSLSKGNFKILHRFAGQADGKYPFAGLIPDGAGNLYGTTVEGGGTACFGNGCGTVFKISEK